MIDFDQFEWQTSDAVRLLNKRKPRVVYISQTWQTFLFTILCTHRNTRIIAQFPHTQTHLTFNVPFSWASTKLSCEIVGKLNGQTGHQLECVQYQLKNIQSRNLYLKLDSWFSNSKWHHVTVLYERTHLLTMNIANIPLRQKSNKKKKETSINSPTDTVL